MVAVLFDGDQGADQVGAGAGASLVDSAAQVCVQFDVRGLDTRPLLIVDRGGEGEHAIIGPSLEICAIPRIDTEHLGDDDRRQRPGERFDQVEGVAAGNDVEQFVDDLLDARRNRFECARSEGLAHTAAEVRVSRRI